MKKTMIHPNFWIRRLLFAASAVSVMAVPAMGYDDGFGQSGGVSGNSGFVPPVTLGDPPVPPTARGTRDGNPIAHSDVPDLPSRRPTHKKDDYTQGDAAPPLVWLTNIGLSPDYSDLLIDIGSNVFEDQSLTRPPSAVIPWIPAVPIPAGGSIGGYGQFDVFVPNPSATTIPAPGVLPLVGLGGLALAGRRRR